MLGRPRGWRSDVRGAMGPEKAGELGAIDGDVCCVEDGEDGEDTDAAGLGLLRGRGESFGSV